MRLDELTRVDRYLESCFVPEDPAIEAAILESVAAGLPPHQLSRTQAKLLHLLARIAGARRVLEIGTLGGVSAICLARALPTDGRVVTLEVSPKHAEVARENIAHAELSSRIEILVGPALDTLAELEGPFDLVFIDADKPNNPAYFRRALELCRVGSVIVCDNVVREGKVADADSDDPSVRGIREMNELVAKEPRVSATAIQTVGDKGWDGFLLARVER
jgi:predicted O-methyltransferase YrrM